MKITDMELCSGCGACAASCPCEAIYFEEDQYGRRVPMVMEDKCIKCNKCVKTCPVNNNFFLDSEKEPKCFALRGNDNKVITGCSSGGIATVAARFVVNNGGYVYGCGFNSDEELDFMECSSEEELEYIKGSKYVQSNLLPCYLKIKKRLDAGEDVLVIGLPCQIAGIKGYLKKEYSNLILIDLICHGTPPIKYLKEHLEKYIADGARKITFRGKDGFVLSVTDRDGKEVYSERAKRDEYYFGFLQGLIYRENCYRCPYATTNRGSDITIGDFWGLDKKTLTRTYDGPISVGLVNTKKGMAFFEKIKEGLIWEERELSEAVKENEQLNHPMTPDETDRKIFLAHYPKRGFDQAFRKTNLYKNKVKKEKLKGKLVKIPLVQTVRGIIKKIDV